MELIFYVNGTKVIEKSPDPRCNLLEYLRASLHLRGSKQGCGSGGCGACTVMLSSYNRKTNNIQHRAVMACLVPLCGLHGVAVTTVEGIGSTRSMLHPVQERLVQGYGSQCGFCSPGMVMSMYSLLRTEPQPSQQQIQAAIQGNLCRCTGYRPILEAFNTFSQEFECSLGEKCCRNVEPNEKAPQWGTPCCYDDYDNTQEPIFPPDLIVSDSLDNESLCFKSTEVTWYRPVSLSELLGLKKANPTATIIAGNTMLGQRYQKNESVGGEVLISCSHLAELQAMDVSDDGIQVGAAVTIQQLKTFMEMQVNDLPECKTRFFRGLLNSLQVFAGQQIRNMATVGGCISGGWTPNDLNTSLMVLHCKVWTITEDGSEMCMNLSEKRVNADDYVVLTKLYIPFSTKDDYFYTNKQSHRKECDIAQLNSAFHVTILDSTVTSATLGFAGKGLENMLAHNTAQSLVGREWTESTLKHALTTLAEEFTSQKHPWITAEYSQALAAGFLLRFFIHVFQERKMAIPSHFASINTDIGPSQLPQGLQVLTDPPEGAGEADSLYRPVPHESAYLHATGEAVYVDDIPSYPNELYLGLVLSTCALGDIEEVDWQVALSCPGVVDKVDHTDVPGSVPEQDEEVFVTKSVISQGQVIGGILATSKRAAKEAAKKVQVKYVTSKEPVITLQDAIGQQKFLDKPFAVTRGDTAVAAADVLVEGVMSTGGQDHFCLECVACVARPAEKGALEVYITSQSLDDVQSHIATALNISAHKVNCKAKRVGGGFGGKETRPNFLASQTSVAAYKVQRPVRCVLDREENMKIMGGRNECMYKYRAGFMKTGHISTLDVTVYSNAGCTLDLSDVILMYEVSRLFHCYRVPNLAVVGHLCQTNTRSATAFRGFGMLPPMLTMEEIFTKAALKLGMEQHKIRELNFYREGDMDALGQEVRNWTLPQCWERLWQQAHYDKLLQQVDDFNKTHSHQKRGVAITPSSISSGYPVSFLNVGAALVNIFSDGSVLLHVSGVELGQGLHTKMMQVASHVLQIPMSLILSTENSTDIVPNARATGGSTGSDYSGFAVKAACETLLSRLEPYQLANPSGNWKEWVKQAHLGSTNLSATGFYKNDVNYDFTAMSGEFFNYTVQGAAVSVVEVDCLSGQHTILEAELVMDVGHSISPAVDLGQIEGAFMMGYGWLSTEEIRHDPHSGALLTSGPANYKIPTPAAVPQHFNVTLLTISGEPRAVYSSKAIGEPPMFLSASVFFALRHAISAARQERSLSADFTLTPPATPQKVQLLCGGKQAGIVWQQQQPDIATQIKDE